jgi:hypothetical protein
MPKFLTTRVGTGLGQFLHCETKLGPGSNVPVTNKRRGRKPIFNRAMTPAERQRRCRAQRQARLLNDPVMRAKAEAKRAAAAERLRAKLEGEREITWDEFLAEQRDLDLSALFG